MPEPVQMPVEIAALHRLAEQDGANNPRHYKLDAVRFEVDTERQQVVAVATDGRYLAVACFAGDTAIEPREPFLVPADVLASLESVDKHLQTRSPRMLTIEADADALRVSEANGTCRRSVSLRPVEGKFPDWRDTAKLRDAEQEVRLRVDPHRLIELLTVAAEIATDGEERRSVELRIALEPDRALHVVGKCGKREFVGMLMPMAKEGQ